MERAGDENENNFIYLPAFCILNFKFFFTGKDCTDSASIKILQLEEKLNRKVDSLLNEGVLIKSNLIYKWNLN